MIVKIELKKIDCVNMKVVCNEKSVLYDLADELSFEVPGYQYMKAYKTGRWDGIIRLLNLKTKQTLIGIAPYIKNFCESRNYEFEIDKDIDFDSINVDVNDDVINKYNPHNEDKKPIRARADQIKSVCYALQKKRVLIESPTSSGKSLSIYGIIRELENEIEYKILLVVPTVNLVKQMYQNFKEYSIVNKWNVDNHCAQIFQGQDKSPDKKIYISTWQSIYKMKEEYFKKFGVIICDEVHKATADSIRNITLKCTRADYRIGLTGTLKESKTHKLMLEGVFGKSEKIISTKELMDKGLVSNLKIKCVILNYSDAEKKEIKRVDYQSEIKWLTENKKRNKIIAELADKREGNVLVLCSYIKHGKELVDLLKNSNKTVYFVHGKIKADDREEIRMKINNSRNVILIATYGVMELGVNIPNLQNLIFAHPYKSDIRVLQSIGRVLRLDHHTNKAVLFDIVDNLKWKSYINHTLNHWKERVDSYNKQGFKYSFHNISF